MIPFGILKTQSFFSVNQMLINDGYIETDCTERKSDISDRLFLCEYTLYNKDGGIVDRVYHAEYLDNSSKPFHDFAANKDEWLTAAEAEKFPMYSCFPEFLNGLTTLYYSVDDDFCEYAVCSEPENTVILAICKDKSSYYLLRCDENFDVLVNSEFKSVEDCKQEAERIYDTYIQWVRK